MGLWVAEVERGARAKHASTPSRCRHPHTWTCRLIVLEPASLLLGGWSCLVPMRAIPLEHAVARTAERKRPRKQPKVTAPVKQGKTSLNDKSRAAAALRDQAFAAKTSLATTGLALASAPPAFADVQQVMSPMELLAQPITIDWRTLFQLAVSNPWLTLAICGALAWFIPQLIKKFILPILGIILLGGVRAPGGGRGPGARFLSDTGQRSLRQWLPAHRTSTLFCAGGHASRDIVLDH